MYAINLSWEQSNNALAWAIESQAHLRLTVRLAREWLEVSSQFLGGETLKSLLISTFPQPWTEKILAGQLLPCSFRRGHRKHLFVSAIMDSTMVDVGGESREAYVLCWPDGLQEMQRRHYFRAAVPKDYDLSVRIWPTVPAIDPHPQGEPLTVGRLIDVSAGGAQMELPEGQRLEVDGSYLVEIELLKPEPPVVVLARSRRMEVCPETGRCFCGLQFLSLDHSPQGRETMFRLTRFANYLRRHEPVKTR